MIKFNNAPPYSRKCRHIPGNIAMFCFFKAISSQWSLSMPSKPSNRRPEVFCKKGALRNFVKFTGKHLFQRLFFNNNTSPQKTSDFLMFSRGIEKDQWLELGLKIHQSYSRVIEEIKKDTSEHEFILFLTFYLLSIPIQEIFHPNNLQKK